MLSQRTELLGKKNKNKQIKKKQPLCFAKNSSEKFTQSGIKEQKGSTALSTLKPDSN